MVRHGAQRMSALEATRANKNVYYIVLIKSGSLEAFTAFSLNTFLINGTMM